LSEVEFHVGNAKICLVQGDITDTDVDAIVNAANSSLMGGEALTGQFISGVAQEYLKSASV
jgi:O-acetyl-ADP-ribose deacetylase (regulator of RNase III)